MRLRRPHRSFATTPQARPAHFPVIHVRSDTAFVQRERSYREKTSRVLDFYQLRPGASKAKKGEQEIRDRRTGPNASNYNQRTRIERFSMHYREIYDRRRLPPALIDFLVTDIQPLPNVSFSLVGFVLETGMTGTERTYRVCRTLEEDKNTSRRNRSVYYKRVDELR